MTHQEEYDKIINFRKANPLPEDQYGENHHIVPKSICPLLKDAPDNIIRLSAQEHFLAHYHLWLAYRDELKDKTYAKKMCYAFHRMKQQLLKCDDVESMAKLYEEVRIEFSKVNSKALKGRKNPNAIKAMRKARLGSHNTPEANEANRKAHLGNNHWFGRHHTEESKEKISNTRKQRGCGIGNKNAIGGKGHLGLKWITNDVEEKTIKEGQLPPEGWKFGRCKFKQSK